MSKAEFYNPPSNNQGCSYASLGRYNGGCECNEVNVQPYPCSMIVPIYKPPTYDTLTKGGCVCGSHRSLRDAYDGGCNQKYSSRPCNSCNFGCKDNQYVGINPVIVEPIIVEPIVAYPERDVILPSEYLRYQRDDNRMHKNHNNMSHQKQHFYGA
jgi:hypothetical protein